MKILLVQNRYYPAKGGGEKHSYLLAKHLALDGHNVTIYTSSSLATTDVHSLVLRPPFILTPRTKTNLPSQEVILNTVVRRYRMTWRFWSLNWIPEMFRELKQRIGDFDLVHAHGYHHSAALASCYYANKFHKPFVLTGHDLVIPGNLPADAQFFTTMYDKTFGRYLLQHSDGLIALTEDQVEQYTVRGGDERKITIIPNGIELERYSGQQLDRKLLVRYDINEGGKVLLFVGRIEEYKGIQDAIAILPQVLESFPETKLLITGLDYGFQSQLEKLIAQKHLEANVVLTGSLPEEQLVQLFKLATLFVFPSRMEGFGIVLLEAMASGTLCIAYSIPAVQRIIENGFNGVLVRNKSELLDQILFYFSHPEKKAEIERNALNRVQAYNIRDVASATERVYARCLQ
jgi:glycosyltransferase involved in cell wall biosynthesis